MSTVRKPMTAAEAEGKDTNSILAGFVDRSPWTFWDQVNTTGAGQLASSYTPFAVPIGGQDPVTGTAKTKLQTNMRKGNEFPPPQCLILFSLQIFFSPIMSKADIAKWMMFCYIEFRIDEKIFHEGHIQRFPGGGGLYGVSTNSAESSWTNGLATPNETVRWGPWSRYIAPNQNFTCTVTFPGTAPTLDAASQVTFYLDGVTDRSVQ